MLTPNWTHGSSPFGSNELLSENNTKNTTPSFDPEEISEDTDMGNWTHDDLAPFPPLDNNRILQDAFQGPVASPNAHGVGMNTATGISGEHHHTWPISPRPTASPSPMKRGDDDEPIITHIRRAETDGSTSSWRVISPIVKVEDLTNDLPLASSVESLSTGTGNTSGNGLSSPTSLQVGGRPRSRSDVGARTHRDEEGVWGGLSPEMRRGLVHNGSGLGIGQGTDYLPMNLKEQEQFRKTQEKNMEVEEWLRRSPILYPRGRTKGSENGGLRVPKNRERRSNSISDFRVTEGAGRHHRGIGNGAMEGLEDETDSSEGVSQMDSDWEEGSLDAWGEESGYNTTEIPAHPDIMNTAEEEPYDPDKDPKLLPKPHEFYSSKPWRDDPSYGPTPRGIAHRNQPPCSNAAISRFREYADNLETASRVATFGSARGHSHGMTSEDAEKFVNTEGILKRLSFGKGDDREKEKSPRDRKTSIFEFPFKGLKRTSSNTTGDGPPKSPLGEGHSRRDSATSGTPPQARWRPSWATPWKGKLNIDTAIGAMTGQLAVVGAADQSRSTSPIPGLPGAMSLGPPSQGTKRSRSKSDLSATIGSKLIKPRTMKPEFGLATMMHMHGGPPMIPITSPSATTVVRRHTFESTTSIPNSGAAPKTSQSTAAGMYDSDEEDDADITIAKPTKKLDIKPTLEGYAANVRELNPLLMSKLVDRIAHEQVKRYKKLQDHRARHVAAVARGDCPNKQKCFTLGTRSPVSAGPVPPTTAGSASDDNDGNGDGTVVGALYPFGVPEPPVSRLPAEFECTICFKVKRFSKPSDWTKHVHEDVQPFTCTFPDCNEPKSFKRKADWVRHENERHRHLEWWKCNQLDCQHICYRKDNFVQHLVREHKFPEPKVKAAKAAMKARKGDKKFGRGGDPVQEQADRVLAIVETCHNENKKEPSSEKCRFCGVTCGSWKKLTVHLAKHMEQISLPILDLLKDNEPSTDSASGGDARSPADSASVGTATPVTPAIGSFQPRSATMDVDITHTYQNLSTTTTGNATPPPPSQASCPSTPIGGIGYYHNPPRSTSNSPQHHLGVTASMAYLNPGDSTKKLFQNTTTTADQQKQQYYPSPSGSASPYLNASPQLIAQQHQKMAAAMQQQQQQQQQQGYMQVTPTSSPPRSSHGNFPGGNSGMGLFQAQSNSPYLNMGGMGMCIGGGGGGGGGAVNMVNMSMNLVNMNLSPVGASGGVGGVGMGLGGMDPHMVFPSDPTTTSGGGNTTTGSTAPQPQPQPQPQPTLQMGVMEHTQSSINALEQQLQYRHPEVNSNAEFSTDHSRVRVYSGDGGGNVVMGGVDGAGMGGMMGVGEEWSWAGPVAETGAYL